MLRALSQTCRLLRALALPRLWKVTHVKTVDELGRLRQTLRISPSVAQHIKSFCFLWKMDGDIWSFEEYEEEEGTFLELAFRNRWLMWEVLRQKLGCEIERRGGDGRAYFVYDEDEYYEPWAPKNVVVGEPRERGPTYSGPDGSGDDRLIENAEQFISSMSEILVQLVRLETFGWDTPMTPIPAKAFKTLSELKLSSLRLDMSKRQGNTHACEYQSGVQRSSEYLGQHLSTGADACRLAQLHSGNSHLISLLSLSTLKIGTLTIQTSMCKNRKKQISHRSSCLPPPTLFSHTKLGGCFTARLRHAQSQLRRAEVISRA